MRQALCLRAPFLPHLDDAELHLGGTPEAFLLDRQFRLLREDIMGPLREAMVALSLMPQSSRGLISTGGQQPGQGQNQLHQRNVYPVVGVLGVAQKPKPCVMVAIQLPMSHRAARLTSNKEREEFWTDHGRGTLPLDALVCLVVHGPNAAISGGTNSETSPPQPIVVFATVGRRDVKELAGHTSIIGLAFDRGQGVEQVLQLLGQGRLMKVSLVQVRCYGSCICIPEIAIC